MKEEDFYLLSGVYETGNVTKAAEKLYVSQPTLSYRINQIEKELNIKLFFRKNNRIIFTEEGKLLIEFAKEKIIEFQHVRQKIKNIKSNEISTIHIGVSSNFGLYKLPSILNSFRNMHNNINVRIFSGWSHEVIKGLSANKIQVGIVTGEYEWYGEKMLFSKDPLTIISKKPIDLSNLPSEPRINYEPSVIRQENNLPFNSIKSLVNNWWHERYKTPPNVIMDIDTVETCKEMVNNDLGYSIIPSSSLKEENTFETRDLTNKDGTTINRNTYILFEGFSLELSPVKNFIDFLQSNTI